MLRIVGFGALLACLASQEPQAPPGLPKRVPWDGSRLAGSPDPPLPFVARRAFPKLDFKHPLYMACEPGTGRVVVVEQAGRVLSFANDAAAAATEVFCELKDADTYSVCFAPDYAKNPAVYVFSNGPNSQKRKKNRILRFRVSGGRCDPKSEEVVIDWESNGHNGGEMAFGPDGFLYISSGDGTSDSDTDMTGQDPGDLLSGILRIDVERPDPGRAYSVPRDNPFLQLPGARPELWAYGFRNPWRMTFDPKTGDLWTGDIGQDLWEMVHVVKRGANHGWSVTEGGRPFQLKRKPGPTPVSPPTIAHPHSEMRSVTGGVVYAGPKFPDLGGAYVYADYSTGRVWAARYAEGKVVWHREIADTTYEILGLAQDPAGEIYLVDYKGQVYRLEAAPPAPPGPPFPRRLSETGLFASVAGHVPHPALVPYDVNSPLWSDGAHKERFIALPGEATIGFTEDGAWKLPEGTVLVKTFSYGGRRHETRLLVLLQGEWAGFTYEWNGEQTEATLVEKGGADRELAPGGRAQAWRFPSRAECMVCHSRAAGFVLGLNTLQMNKGEQFRRLERAGVFRVNVADILRARERLAGWLEVRGGSLPIGPLIGFDALSPVRTLWHAAWAASRKRVMAELGKNPRTSTHLPKGPEDYPRLPDPYDAAVDIGRRARSYLHANCAQCHVEAGGGNSAFNVHWNSGPEKMKLVGAAPAHDAFGIAGALLLAPGEPERSVLYLRLSQHGTGRMPPLATSRVDDEAAMLIRNWILQLRQ